MHKWEQDERSLNLQKCIASQKVFRPILHQQESVEFIKLEESH
jgi:signal transduction histidine kinase